jgi:hypothetical protein
MTEFIAALFLVTMTAGIAVLLEINHRRTDGLPRAPFGVDLEGDADLLRLRHDLDSGRSRASQVANRSTGVSNSGCTSVNSWSRSASQARVTSSSPRRVWSSSIPRSVKYTSGHLERSHDSVALLDRAADRFERRAHQALELLDVAAVLTDRR